MWRVCSAYYEEDTKWPPCVVVMEMAGGWSWGYAKRVCGMINRQCGCGMLWDLLAELFVCCAWLTWVELHVISNFKIVGSSSWPLILDQVYVSLKFQTFCVCCVKALFLKFCSNIWWYYLMIESCCWPFLLGWLIR